MNEQVYSLLLTLRHQIQELPQQGTSPEELVAFGQRVQGLLTDALPALLERQTPALDPSTLTPQERAFGDYAPGRFAWQMSEVRALEVLIPCAGKLRLWMLPDIIRDQVYKGLLQLQ